MGHIVEKFQGQSGNAKGVLIRRPVGNPVVIKHLRFRPSVRAICGSAASTPSKVA